MDENNGVATETNYREILAGKLKVNDTASLSFIALCPYVATVKKKRDRAAMDIPLRMGTPANGEKTNGKVATEDGDSTLTGIALSCP